MKNPNTLTSYDILFLSLTLLVLVMLSLQLPIIPSDYWWCLRVGHETILNKAVPAIETFSWTQTGKPIVYQPWLACVAFWSIYNLGGATLTFLLRAILLAIAYGVIWYMARRESGPRLASILIIVLGLATSDNWVMRTQLFAYPLFAIFLYALFQWQQGNNRMLWLLPLTTLIWTNMHGSFILALLLAGTAFVFGKGDRKALFLTGVIMLVATLITPHGLNGWRQVVFMLNNPSDQKFSVEWFPPKNEGWQAHIFFGWILLMIPLVTCANRKFSLLEWALVLGFGWLALSGIRYIIWFLFILAVLTARLFDDITQHRLESKEDGDANPKFNYLLAVIFALVPLLALPGIRDSWISDPPPAYNQTLTPIKATTWLQDHPDLPGPIFNDDAFGSYLIYALSSRPVWLDARYFVYPPDQMETHQKISTAHPDWETLLDQHKINLLMLSTANQPRLITSVERSNIWCEQYRDKIAVIFSRCTPIQ